MNTSDVLQKFISSLKSFYNINLLQNQDVPCLYARCDYFEHSQKFMVSKKANLWTADCEEFIYVFSAKNLSEEIFDSCMDFVNQDWKNQAHIGSGHMYTYVTPVFICAETSQTVIRKIKKCRIKKNFLFCFHGWMEYHAAIIECKNESTLISSNFNGRCVKKMLEKIFCNP